MIVVAFGGIAHAGLYAKVGDKFEYSSGGKIAEVIKVKPHGDSTKVKVCLKAPGDKACKWAKVGDLKNGEWVVYDGVPQK